MRDITNDRSRRSLQIVRRSSGSVVKWRRTQMVLFSAQGMDVAQIAKVAFTSLASTQPLRNDPKVGRSSVGSHENPTDSDLGCHRPAARSTRVASYIPGR